MSDVTTDYLVVGAGANAMAFADVMIDRSPHEVVLVDRRAAPGGHWLDAYPFVRLHQPSAYYGVNSRPLGQDRIDTHGINAGFYERASADEIREYYREVLERHLLPSGRVRFFGLHDYLCEDAEGHHLVSLLTGRRTVVKVRRRLVDATHLQSEIPLRHPLPFSVDPGVRVLPPNDLVNLGGGTSRFTVIGAGKTAMDSCCWLLEMGVDPDRIRWIRTRESWLFNREFLQPLDLVAQFMRMQAHWVEAAARAKDGSGFAHDLESRGVFLTIDPEVEPGIWRGPTIGRPEVDALRTITRVERRGKVRAIGARSLVLDGVELPSSPDEVYVDCTAAGVPPAEARTIFEPGRITIGYVTVGLVTWTASIVAAVEASDRADAERNRLCRSYCFSGEAANILAVAGASLRNTMARGAEPDLAAWDAACRLNPARSAGGRMHDPDVAAAYSDLAAAVGPALRNLASLGV